MDSEIEIETVPPEHDDGEMKARNPASSPRPSSDLEPCTAGMDAGLRPATSLRIEGVSGYQAVEVPLAVAGEAVSSRDVHLVQGRDVLVRVFVTPLGGAKWSPVRYRAHLRLFSEEDDQSLVYEDVRVIVTRSAKYELESTFNFYVPGEDLVGRQQLAVELWEVGPCLGSEESANRLPPTGGIPLKTRATGPVRVHLVPIRYEADGSGRMPDVSPGHRVELASLLAAIFPASHVELSVREPVGTTETTMGDILNQLLQLRAIEDPPHDVSYYGLVNPAASMAEYCGRGCVAGVATFGPASGAASVGVGIGYAGPAAQTFVHEIGHIYRLMHAPCGGPRGVDPDFPHEGAVLGSWGYDMRSGTLIDPVGGRRDFMSYCNPSWISDYNYRFLMDRLAVVNGMHQGSTPFVSHEWGAGYATGMRFNADDSSDAKARNREGLRVYKTLRVDGAGRLRWGLPMALRSEPGVQETARVLDVEGAVRATIDVFRLEMSDAQGSLYFVPQSKAGWHSLVLEGQPPHSFADPRQIRPFLP